MNRRHFLASTAAAALAACATENITIHSERKPNVIVILADDLGYGDIGAFGNGVIRTPNLDRMAAEGARLTNFYASANICTPSRAGLLTGRYPVRTGLGWQVIQPNDTRGLPHSEITIAEALKPDYTTALIGKWHLGHTAPAWPPIGHGFDLFFGLPYSHDMKPLSLFSGEAGVELTQEDVAMDRLTERFFNRGFQFIEANRERPFFLMLTLTAPHVPLDPHPDHAGKSAAAEYGDVVEEIDANVGRLIAKLKQLNLDKDTLVIVTSDNGPWWEGSSGGLRDRKGGAGWDGGYRVPFIARQPGRIPVGYVSDAIAMNIDLLPTIVLVSGSRLPAAELDGKDISGVLMSRNPSPHDELILFNNEDVAAIRTARWKYVVRSYYRGIEAPLDTPGRNDWPVLIDMANDPSESYDVSSRHPEILADMQARLERARAKYAPFKAHKDAPA
jgi:arylsulfatase A